MTKIGLALGGGAALGWAHIGVIRTLYNESIPIHAVAGTSIGAVVGAAIVEDKLDHLEELARNVKVATILRFLDPSFKRGSMLGGRTVMAELRRHFGAARIEDMAIPFCAVAADLVSGQEIWLKDGPIVDAVRSSISLPGLFAPVHRGPYILADGGLINPVPVNAARSLGVDKVIAVNLQADYRGRAKAAGLEAHQPLPRRATINITRASMGLMLRSLTDYRFKTFPADVLISPEIGHIEVGDFTKAHELIECGCAAVYDKLNELKALCA
ncbi:MAG: patatin-like phospholipase family protein [Sphingomonadales bacterium]|jgi:NTE family protein